MCLKSNGINLVVFVLPAYLKNRLKHVASLGCQISLLHLLLTARAATATTMNIQQNLDNYAQWYKQNIGEMSYTLGGNEQFQVVLNILEDSVHYEMEIDYLEVSISIYSSIALLSVLQIVSTIDSCTNCHLAWWKTRAVLQEQMQGTADTPEGCQ